MDKFVALAKQAVEKYVKTGKVMAAPSDLPAEFLSKAGVFVTIKKNNELRGCVGTYLPTKENLAQEIISNAIAACAYDGRFYPVGEEELPDLNYEVSILSPPQKIETLKNHNPKKHGLIVASSDGRRGLLLPDLEGVDTVEDQINIACQKGGIDPLEDEIEYYSFTVEKHI